MKIDETKNTGHYKIANVGAIGLIIFLGVISIFEGGRAETNLAQSEMGFCILVALLLLIPVFRMTKVFSKLAFYVPLVLFAFNTMMMILNVGANAHYFLITCFLICGISCLYANFSASMGYAAFQFVAIVALGFLGYPIAGSSVSLFLLLIIGVVFLFFCVTLLLLTRTATIELDAALNEGNSFRTFLATTANYLAMVDKSNEVLYVSQPLSQLAGIENADLTTGRPFIDLFPGRELKLLAGKMLGQRELCEADWEFVLDGQKRFFKAASNVVSGTAKGTLINLHDMTFLAERDEIAAMRDSLKIGLFFMDRNFVIQDNYSRYLDELLSDQELNGQKFTDLLTASVTPKELESIKDYFIMVFDRVFDHITLEDINPLKELHYVSIATKATKIFQCEFIPVERGRGEVFLLVTIYDITVKVELQQRLLEEESRRQEEMRSMFELIQVEPTVFSDFLDDAEYEFTRIDDTLRNDKLSSHEALVEIYQSVHAIKSNAVILGLNTFGNKVHDLESKIKKLREQEAQVPFDDMLHLTVEIEKLSHEKDNFRLTIDKIKSFKVEESAGGQKQNQKVLIESLLKTTNKAAEDLGKKVRFVPGEIDSEAIEKGPRRVVKEVLMQLIRNSVVHGVETPEERLAKGKNETGTVRLSIKTDGKVIHVKLGDDGRGLDFTKISKKAMDLKLIKAEDANNKGQLLNVIFAPGFSTAETEGVHAGRGIGLNLVRDRVRDEKGTIKLQTELDKGTIFNIFFPMGTGTGTPQNKAS